MRLLALTLAVSTAFPAHAGGPVIIEEPESGAPAALLSPGEKVALAAGLLLLGALIAGGGGGGEECPCLTPDEGGQCVC